MPIDFKRKENKYEKFRKHDKERITRGYRQQGRRNWYS